MYKDIKLVIYKRVSTNEQNKTHLGLKAQQRDIMNFIKNLQKQNETKIINSYTEIASGKSLKNRYKLNNAINECKNKNAYLIVQKVDRLSRNIKDGITIFEDLNKKVLFSDINTNNSMIIAVFLAHAQNEREQISLRTKKSLYELKIKGKKLGRPYKKYRNGKIIKGQNQYAIQKMIKIKKQNIANYYLNNQIFYIIKDQLNNKKSYLEIANYLNKLNKKKFLGKQFFKQDIYYLTKKYQLN